jgi:hypothetical protein
MNTYERIAQLIYESLSINEGKVKVANKKLKREFESKQGRKADAHTPDPDPEGTIKKGELAAKHGGGTAEGVLAIQRARYRAARKTGQMK